MDQLRCLLPPACPRLRYWNGYNRLFRARPRFYVLLFAYYAWRTFSILGTKAPMPLCRYCACCQMPPNCCSARHELRSLPNFSCIGFINFPAFARFVYRLNPTFLQRLQRAFASPHWWIEQEEGRPLQPTQWNDWLRAEGRYLARLLQGPLYWWGASDLALSADGRLLAFRLTSMAGFLLNGLSIIEQDRLLANGPAEPAIEMSEQGELSILSSPENWPVIELIERFAEVQGVQAGRLSYRLTPKSLGEALHRGEVFAPLLDLLHRVVDASSIENSSMASALYQLERRIAHYGRARLYTDVPLLHGDE